MEAAGLAFGIVGLYTTCRDCYTFFTTVKTSEAEASAHVRELVIQQSILKAWGFHWEIQHENDDRARSQQSESTDASQKRTRLHQYLSANRFKAEGVFNALSALADTLSNQEKLIKRYGIKLQPLQAIQDASSSSQPTTNVGLSIQESTIENIEPVITEVKSRLSVLTKFKWALKDKESFKKLISDLKSHSESLYRLCPETAFQSMNIYLTMDCLSRQESPAGLKWTSRLAAEHAVVDERSSVREGYKLLASAATLKASVNENKDKAQDGNRPLTDIEEAQPEMWYLGKSLAVFEDQVVYVEMRDYRGPPLGLTPEQKQKLKRRQRRARVLNALSGDFNMDSGRLGTKAGVPLDERIYVHSGGSDEDDDDDEPIEPIRPADPKLRALIKNFYNTFKGEGMMESVCGLNIAGMIDHTEGEHKGHCSILYKLPGTIGHQSRERPAENLKLRAPVTLKSLLGDKRKGGIRSSLGKRFELAKSLVRAVCLLHSSGWLHKNIRAESVIFFPEHVNTLQEDRWEVKIEIDVSKPILMGYIFSRPDEIIRTSTTTNELKAQSQTQQNLVPPPVNRVNTFRTKTEMTRVWDRTDSYYYDNMMMNINPMLATPKRKTSSWGPQMDGIYGRDMSGRQGISDKQPKDIVVSGFILDSYQHPAKHADPKRQYRHAYDVYSLGILLLEVGLWEELRNYTSADDEEDHYERRRWICREYMDRLRWECGDVYANVVLSCLMIDSTDDEVAKASERELCARLVADLEGCQA